METMTATTNLSDAATGETTTSIPVNPIPFLGTHNAVVTLVSPKTGDHRTFRVTTAKRGPLEGRRILELLVGQNNESDYKGFGFIQEDGTVRLWRKYEGTIFAQYADLIDRPTYWANRGVQYMAEGRCRCCNRRLSNPESLRTGIGPECAKRGY